MPPMLLYTQYSGSIILIPVLWLVKLSHCVIMSSSKAV